MIIESVILFTDILILAILVCHSLYERKNDKTNNKIVATKSITKKERELTDEEKRDLEILDMIEKYDGKSIRKEE